MHYYARRPTFNPVTVLAFVLIALLVIAHASAIKHVEDSVYSSGSLPPPLYLGLAGRIIGENGSTITLLVVAISYSLEGQSVDKVVIHDSSGDIVLDPATCRTRMLEEEPIIPSLNNCLLTLKEKGLYNMDVFLGNGSVLEFKLIVSPQGRILFTIPETIWLGEEYLNDYYSLLAILEEALEILEEFMPSAETRGYSVGIAFSITPVAAAFEQSRVVVYGGSPNFWKKVFDGDWYMAPIDPSNTTSVFQTRITLDTLVHELAHLATPETAVECSLDTLRVYPDYWEEVLAIYWEHVVFDHLVYANRSYKPIFHDKLYYTSYDYYMRLVKNITSGCTPNITDGPYWYALAGMLIDLTYNVTEINRQLIDYLTEVNITELIENLHKACAYPYEWIVKKLGRNISTEEYGYIHLLAALPPKQRLEFYSFARSHLNITIGFDSYQLSHIIGSYIGVGPSLANTTIENVGAHYIIKGAVGNVWVELATLDRQTVNIIGVLEHNNTRYATLPGDTIAILEVLIDGNEKAILSARIRLRLSDKFKEYFLKVYHYTGGEWVETPSTLEDTGEDGVLLIIEHMGPPTIYAVLAEKPKIITKSVTETLTKTETSTMTETHEKLITKTETTTITETSITTVQKTTTIKCEKPVTTITTAIKEPVTYKETVTVFKEKIDITAITLVTLLLGTAIALVILLLRKTTK